MSFIHSNHFKLKCLYTRVLSKSRTPMGWCSQTTGKFNTEHRSTNLFTRKARQVGLDFFAPQKNVTRHLSSKIVDVGWVKAKYNVVDVGWVEASLQPTIPQKKVGFVSLPTLRFNAICVKDNFISVRWARCFSCPPILQCH